MLRLRGWLVAGLGLSLGLAAWAAPNWKTLTDAPRNIDGQGYNYNRPLEVPYADGKFVVVMPDDGWVLNAAGAMGADNEYWNENYLARMGVWAGNSLQGRQPRAIVSEWVGNIKKLTGGDWTAPKATTIAGYPVVQATGVDGFGNYQYRVVAFNRMGVNVALATRIPYEQRHMRALDEDITTIVTESHLSTQAVEKMLKKQRRR